MEQLDFWGAVPQPGDWVETHGRELTFDEVAQMEGQLIVYDMSTESREWYKIVRVERIVVDTTGIRRIVFYDGGRQRGMVSEIYFRPTYKARFPARAYTLT